MYPVYHEAKLQLQQTQICEQSGYVMTSLPVLQNHFRFLIFYFCIKHLLVVSDIF